MMVVVGVSTTYERSTLMSSPFLASINSAMEYDAYLVVGWKSMPRHVVSYISRKGICSK